MNISWALKRKGIMFYAYTSSSHVFKMLNVKKREKLVCIFLALGFILFSQIWPQQQVKRHTQT